ncbi:MAG: tol-pal system protein YbgF [Candidatus Eisenbacteria bacterium]|uniref:Tol-pal system protein YbgF n=1 Tax=Eiseniibacteriota bacterium TaxID=2212470 RepID=A0A538U2F2_UNCEI|nr:MAG: tol-pal system protein YbgF [Candidatus Eisenbacteria bacterium]
MGRPRVAEPGPARRVFVFGVMAWLAAGTLVSGCYAPQLTLLRSGLDSLRAVVDTMNVRDSVTRLVLESTRREVTEQRDILLSTRASTGTTTQEMFEQMTRLNGKLDEALGRFQQVSQRTAPATPAGNEMTQFYDQASLDLTQGRYGMAVQEFRDFLRRFPTSELADNAQYGIGECFFAQSAFDSAEVEYGRVETAYPTGDKVPAALYKLALSRERLNKSAAARKTLEDLIKRYPNSGEAQLARERLGGTQRR